MTHFALSDVRSIGSDIRGSSKRGTLLWGNTAESSSDGPERALAATIRRMLVALANHERPAGASVQGIASEFFPAHAAPPKSLRDSPKAAASEERKNEKRRREPRRNNLGARPNEATTARRDGHRRQSGNVPSQSAGAELQGHAGLHAHEQSATGRV